MKVFYSWPMYTNTPTGLQAYAVQVAAIDQADDGSAVIDVTGNNAPDYNASPSFMALWKPVVGGWLVFINSQLVYYSSSAFSAGFAVTTTGNALTAAQLATARAIALAGGATGTVNFDGSANVSITTTLATPTAVLRGGVLQQAAITALTDSSGGTSGGNTIPAVSAATAAATDTSAASLTSTNAAITALKNDIATLAAKLNVALTEIKAAGVTA